MYSFDGDFRRRPIQNLGGKTTTSDRDEVIRKAQVEREKRNLLRKQNNGAIVIQSYSRSFLHRQRKKCLEREKFDELLEQNNHLLQNENNLSVALRRLIFFYSSDKDCNRLIEVCQQIIKNPDKIIVNAVTDSIWLHRIKKLLNLCLTQLGVQNLNQTIPLRTLETFASGNYIIKHMQKETNLEDNEKINELKERFLKNLFDYLIQHGNYFKRIRIILENKCPPLDGETIQPPNQLCRALFEMILWPMQLVKNNEHMYCESFAKYILSPEFSESIRYFILPSLATRKDFPFRQLINCLGFKLCNRNLQKMDIDDQESFSRSCNNNSNALKYEINSDFFSSFLLNSIFILDSDILDELEEDGVALGNYIKIISTISPKILNLPKSTLKQSPIDNLDDDDISDDSDSGMPILTSNPPLISPIETKTLLEIVNYLNSTARVKLICQNVHKFISDSEILYSLCKLCHNLMVYNKNAIMCYELLYNLAFMPEFIRAIWYTLASQSAKQGFSSPLILISKGMVPKSEIEINRTIAFLATFCALFGRLLPTRHDGEFKREHSFQHDCYQGKGDKLLPFSIDEIVQLSKTLKEISLGLVELAFPETRSALNEHYRSVLGRSHSDDEKIKQKKQVWTNLLNVVVTVLNQIHARDLRMSFCPENHWTVLTLNLPLDKPTDLPLTRANRMRGIRPFQPIRDFTREDFENNDGPPISTKQIRSITILREIPFVVPFNQRVSILQGLIAADKIRVQGNLQGFLHGPSILLTVRRSHLYEDAYDKLRPENEPDLRHKFRVQFTNSLGLSEVGIDGGGLFREFLSELIKAAFDPNRGFFMITIDNRLYPNPGVADIIPDFEKHYYFMGRILGKAIYENLLVELPLAEFFLSKLAGKYSDVDVHQLASLDPELYKNLLSLKEYDGDVSELGLDFTVVSNDLGKTEVKDLKPNGKDIIVNSSNKIEYIQLMADYKLNKQIRQHCVAFRKGLSNVLPVEWLYMFSNKELQILISGAEIPIDSEDLQKYCKYGGEYSPEHPTIQCFWKVFDEFTDTQRRQLLKFVTSCSRPPLLGFKDLDPPFLIQNAGNEERLPTASTCTNLLKLPAFKTIEQMREKLLYAIQAEAGFDLS